MPDELGHTALSAPEANIKLAAVIFDRPRNHERMLRIAPQCLEQTLQLGAIAGVDQGSVIVLYTVAPTLGSGNAGLEKLLTAGPRPNSADRCRAWYGPAYANSSCAQAGYLWSAVEADGDVLSFDSARVWMTTRWAESGRFAARSHLIWGRQDRHIPREGRGRIHAALEDAGTRFSWVEVNGHHLASDRPAVTTEPATGEEADGSE